MSGHDDDGLDGLVARLQTKLQAATGIKSDDLCGMVDMLVVDARLARRERDAALARNAPPTMSLTIANATGVWTPMDGEL